MDLGMLSISRPILAALVSSLALLITGCASGPAVDSQITDSLTSHGVTGATYQKVYGGQALGYNDIVALVRAGVPSHIIVSYLQSTEKVYNFTASQMDGLTAAGASSEVTHYLSETDGLYAYNPPAAAARTKKRQADQYYNSPLYQDEQPFGYNEPIVDGFYDSGYEESIYSPFSMN
jgi:hypothetical protein